MVTGYGKRPYATQRPGPKFVDHNFLLQLVTHLSSLSFLSPCHPPLSLFRNLEDVSDQSLRGSANPTQEALESTVKTKTETRVHRLNTP